MSGNFVISPRNMNPRYWLPVISYPDDRMIALARASLGEFFGMFVWMFVALGSVPAVEATLGELTIKPESLLVISLAFGFGISISVYMMAEVSGAHLNPTVSFSLMLLKRISVIRCVSYMIAQCLGSVVGAGALRLFITRHQAAISTLGATKLAPEIEWYQGLYIEAMLSTILNFCAIGMATYPFGRTVTPESRWNKVCCYQATTNVHAACCCCYMVGLLLLLLLLHGRVVVLNGLVVRLVLVTTPPLPWVSL
jgi:glycerol uptake facilitator-like aquaporin